MTVLQAEMFTDQIMMAIARGGVTISVNVGKRISAATLDAAHGGAERIIAAYKARRGNSGETGVMTLSGLQEKAGGDLHSIDVSDELITELKADLKERGVDFAIEHAPDGNTYVHFRGADTDTVSHGITQAKATLEKKLDHAKPARTDVNEPSKKPQTRADVAHTVQAKATQKAAAKTPKAARLDKNAPHIVSPKGKVR